jgi:hypothetical protein
MKRTPIARRSPLQRTGRVKAKRATPRRRQAPRWDSASWADADLILSARAGYACEKCGKECGPLERHHRMRRRDGGESYPQILMLGRPCHAEVHAHPAISRKFGWIVSAYVADPSTVPVLWRSKEWVLLREDGGKVDAFVPVGDAHA